MNHFQRLRELTEEISKILDEVEQYPKDPRISILKKPFEGDYKISQHFGENPEIYKKWGFNGHFGIDFATPHGTPILAVDEGEVLRAGYNEGNGNFIELKHKWGTSLYLHFKEPTVLKKGELVKQSQMIGLAGNSGYVIPKPTKENPHAGTHLHFSMKINGVKNIGFKDFVDPLAYIKNSLSSNKK